MSSPPPKRQRQEEVKRSELVWHPDGSVVLQAGLAQFRVHWSFLSLHSSFFRDMQGLPQPPDQPTVDGCPVIELPDSVEDVECVLKALYDPSVLLFFTQKALPLPVIASHVRLGRKYDFTNILHSIVERLTFENPTSLEAYFALRTGKAYRPTRIVSTDALYYDTVALARETNLLSVLPCAYYRVLISSKPIFDGIPRGDGSLATLSPSDQRLCSLGRAAILRAQWDIGNTFGWILDDDAAVIGCTDPSACRRKKTSFAHKHVVKGSILAFPSVDFLDSGPLKLCEVCLQDAKPKMIAGCQEMWQLLPTFFELPPWSELKDDL
ncbi:hypothetical protein DFH09DRAFT_927880 [Mycena vulgaris]|nr:hypothetical protein DFH09DRAFT_927880 [Mycena vulgaris]